LRLLDGIQMFKNLTSKEFSPRKGAASGQGNRHLQKYFQNPPYFSILVASKGNTSVASASTCTAFAPSFIFPQLTASLVRAPLKLPSYGVPVLTYTA